MDHRIAPRRRVEKNDEASAQTDGGILRGGVAGDGSMFCYHRSLRTDGDMHVTV